MPNALVKVCCISSFEEAIIALDAGADFLGLVSEMPSGPGVIPLDEIASIVKAIPSETKTVLLTSKQNHLDILRQHDLVKTWGLQLVDEVPIEQLKKLRKARPDTYLIQVIHVTGERSISQAWIYEGLVDMLLLDSGNPGAEIKTLGGTGNTHDWNISQQICELTRLPVLLAGGLTADNIHLAKNAVNPGGFDLCSGVRTGGSLDKKKLELFMSLVHDR